MPDEKQALVPHVAPSREWSLVPTTLGEAREMAELIANSEFAPKDYKGKPASVLIAIQMGLDVGLKPMQALQSIAVINGRPSIWGDAALALVMPALERFSESFEGTPYESTYTAVCTAKRKGRPDETRQTFSVADAERAGLWKKSGTWSSYPKRMLQMRARGFTLRDVAPDFLLGLVLAEEAQDYPDAIDGTVVGSEPVVVKDPLQGISEGLVESLGKGFAALNMSEAQQLVKVHEFITNSEEKDPDVGAQNLLDWLKDEFSKRKFGQPRQKSTGDNGKKREKSVGSASTAAAANSPGVQAAVVAAQSKQPEVAQKQPEVAEEPPVEEPIQPVTADDILF